MLLLTTNYDLLFRLFVINFVYPDFGLVLMIDTIFIDIDNTLLDFDKCAYLSMKSSFEDCGLPFDDNMFATFERINLALWHRLEDKIIAKEQLFKLRWPTVLAALNLSCDGTRMEQCFKHYLYTYAVTIEGAEDLLIYLSSKYKVYATSNATYEQQISRLKSAGFDKYFNGFFISERAGAEKPSEEFFDYCFSNLTVPKENVAIIGDSPTADIKGGLSYGLTTIWLDRRGENLPDGVKPHFIVSNLADIKNII